MDKKGVGLACNVGDWETVKQRTGATWFLNWSYSDENREGHVPLFAYDYSNHSRAISYAQRCPGSYHLIGNEPNDIWQDNMTPEQAAQAQSAVVEAILNTDPTAKCIVGGVKDDRGYMRRMLRQWPQGTPIAGLHWHHYTWGSEAANIDYLRRATNRFVGFTRRRNPNWEAWLTEFGVIGYGTDTIPEATVVDFIWRSVRYLNRKIGLTRYAWFCWQRCSWQTFPVRELRNPLYGNAYRGS